MILTDREWLRFMTFAFVVGGVLGATNTGALLLQGWPLTHAVVIALTFTGALALIVHGIARTLLDRGTDPDAGDTDTDVDAVPEPDADADAESIAPPTDTDADADPADT